MSPPKNKLFQLADDLQKYKAVFSNSGSHRFGGGPSHKGVVPERSTIALHHLLTFDLKKRSLPFRSQGSIKYLPLYYPLAYGMGGAECQYAVLSNDEIKILYMSDPEPDEKDMAYVQVDKLPETWIDIEKLTSEDMELKGGNFTIYFGGSSPANSGSIYCRNPQCDLNKKEIEIEMIAKIPPIPINGETEFWYEYEGAFLDFCFGLCPYCRTIIAYNVCD